MFCENCGNKLEEAAIFCEECGTRCAEVNEITDVTESNIVTPEPPVEDTIVAPVVTPEVAVPTIKKNKPIFLIIQALLFIILLCAFYITGTKASEPNTIIANYAKAYMAQDYETLALLTPEKFMDLMTPALLSNSASYVANDTYTIDITDGNTKDCTLTYSVSGDDTEIETSFSVTKGSEKHWFLFDTWEIMNAEHITYDFQLAVPNGLRVSYGKELISELGWENTEEDGITTYTIPAAFTGSYSFLVDTGYTEPYLQTVDLSDGYFLFKVDNIDEDQQAELIADNNLIISCIIEHAATNQITTPLEDLLNPYDGFDADSSFSYRYGLVNVLSLSLLDSLTVSNFRSRINAPTYDSKEELYTLIIETDVDCFLFGNVYQYGESYTPPSYIDETLNGFSTEYVYYDNQWVFSDFYLDDYK